MLSDSASWQGGHAFGAFGKDVEAITTWVGHSARFHLGATWTVNASATLGLGHAELEPGAMFDPGPYAISSRDIGLERGGRGRLAWWRVALSQPVRAETGRGSFTYLARLEGGRPVCERATIPLEPDGRELEVRSAMKRRSAEGEGVWKRPIRAGSGTSRVPVAGGSARRIV